ncbi:hypothetical protein [Amycolatopsis sp. Hca4]|uniref:hypothetical protein n=1 Tax=Amycolatopsis sp. Hca4 TaxID=2742131 RepID=UPI00158FD002|nr:hypothetical protein [Amycolatopsis sp. Hca4]QKV77804.1 hypothetical protein HUT10_31500 [Amycolatopsis sp. Hca4]
MLENVLAALNGVLATPRVVLRELLKRADREPDPDAPPGPAGADDDRNPPDYPG